MGHNGFISVLNDIKLWSFICMLYIPILGHAFEIEGVLAVNSLLFLNGVCFLCRSAAGEAVEAGRRPAAGGCAAAVRQE